MESAAAQLGGKVDRKAGFAGPGRMDSTWTENGRKTAGQVWARGSPESCPSRYSPQHKYRPAAAPVITSVGKDGKVYRKGEYY
ncbi:hypothetical protein JCM10049v2_006652 [Rhodotorula toruloides]